MQKQSSNHFVPHREENPGKASKNKGAYYDALTLVRSSNDLRHWVLFFLNGVISTAQSGRETFEKIVTFRNDCEMKILETGKRAANAWNLIHYMYSKPILRHKSNFKTIRYVGLLLEITGYKRNKLYEIKPYLKIFMS